ncbi:MULTISPECIES: StlD/DarB family beta-ketosynthase [Achromobacter]|jgi:3-oxoacyl-[acyl-carrier-protein] synthase-3|uniref:3-oxoacyl-(Acyl carrier protein) synthase III n=1 Tax=Achromobacter aegrifaciens TaxID=1287736 RepID=A0AAD2J397_ACHAE|nr:MULTISPECIES: StlD/DarB family beta-ketosynthase [Achromobacter]MBD9383757.1 iron-containing redox enzyme family protein [Achromobacter sp. ACM02]MBD9422486.1 iron-containing redox enzyme family protein [Achromobacter sp. ACM04]MBD9432184.1 iron-containing redox enzyme family protein [Achromobacter sp. ACM03]MBD9475648.1 iron-containing redox enzyme family protein [Achromobacter sp. ACM01]MDQ1759243.1 iron-containing redox enzyme family protein [Achromobacter aegrifaciens]
MPIAFHRVYLESAGYFMPGEPVSNDAMDSYIAPLNRMSSRIKSRILAENGIKQRYYAIDQEGATVFSNAQLAANAIRDCLRRNDSDLSAVSLLASGSSGGDALMPGFSNMIQGELAAHPMETLSVHGICAAGVSAIQTAAQGVELGGHASALAVASELPSRLFKRSRFAARGYDADFDAHFLRWMLSDGAGAVLLGNSGRPLPGASQGVRLRLKWVHQRSFSGDYPVCMQLGLSADRARGHLDYPSWNEAEADGALSLRQDIRLLPHLFDIGIHEYAKLVRDGWVDPDQVDHFLCHYSSEKFIPVVEDLMEKAGLVIPRERWFSNLAWRGNTGAASILIMLAEFLETREVKPGEQIFCYIPESGRFMAAYMLLEAEAVHAPQVAAGAPAAAAPREDANSDDAAAIAPPHDPDMAPQGLGQLLTELAAIWHDYRSRVWRTPVVRRLRNRQFQTADYLNWMENWIPQVREGSKWMREGAASLTEQYAPLAALIDTHAGEEQNDFQILFQDYRTAGGEVADIDALRRNPGGEALNAYLHGLAATRDPIGLLGAIYIIEGTGQRIVPALLPLLKASLKLPPDAFRFLEYHGHNDEHHLARWLSAVELALDCDEDGRAEQRIVDTARRTAALYLMQFHHVMEGEA